MYVVQVLQMPRMPVIAFMFGEPGMALSPLESLGYMQKSALSLWE